jgi:hypothetical protein
VEPSYWIFVVQDQEFAARWIGERHKVFSSLMSLGIPPRLDLAVFFQTSVDVTICEQAQWVRMLTRVSCQSVALAWVWTEVDDCD